MVATLQQVLIGQDNNAKKTQQKNVWQFFTTNTVFATSNYLTAHTEVWVDRYLGITVKTKVRK